MDESGADQRIAGGFRVRPDHGISVGPGDKLAVPPLPFSRADRLPLPGLRQPAGDASADARAGVGRLSAQSADGPVPALVGLRRFVVPLAASTDSCCRSFHAPSDLALDHIRGHSAVLGAAQLTSRAVLVACAARNFADVTNQRRRFGGWRFAASPPAAKPRAAFSYDDERTLVRRQSLPTQLSPARGRRWG